MEDEEREIMTKAGVKEKTCIYLEAYQTFLKMRSDALMASGASPKEALEEAICSVMACESFKYAVLESLSLAGISKRGRKDALRKVIEEQAAERHARTMGLVRKSGDFKAVVAVGKECKTNDENISYTEFKRRVKEKQKAMEEGRKDEG